MTDPKSYSYAFFGTSEFAVHFLQTLSDDGEQLPELIITSPNRPQGRGLLTSPPPVKIWADGHNIPTQQPEKLDSDFALTLKNIGHTFFMVVSYGKLIPKIIFDMPERKTLNLHPSLLPKYRGASPIESQILNDEKNIGITLMQIDEQMDHGPIVAQTEIRPNSWPKGRIELEKIFAIEGAHLFNKIIENWVSQKIEVKTQDEKSVSVTNKIKKEDGLLDLFSNGYENYLKILAFEGWPRTHFFIAKNGLQKRINVTSASYLENKLMIEKVIPEGGKEISWKEFERNYFHQA